MPIEPVDVDGDGRADVERNSNAVATRVMAIEPVDVDGDADAAASRADVDEDAEDAALLRSLADVPAEQWSVRQLPAFLRARRADSDAPTTAKRPRTTAV